VHNVPLAMNLATADLIIAALAPANDDPGESGREP
jgi:methylglyoxal synthase